ncbi:MAG: GtrA family protein, partial [Planctomycetota bacterium]
MTASSDQQPRERGGHLRQMLTYAVVGVINTLVGGGTTFATIPLLGAYWANVCGYAVGLCVSYLLNSRFTFTGHRAPGALPRFWVGFALAYTLNFAVLRLLAPTFGAYWANAGGIVTYTIAFFLIQKFYVFRPPPPEAGPRTWLPDLGRAALLLLASRALMLVVLLIHGQVTGADCWSAWFQFDANWYADVAAHGYLIAPRFGLGGQANWAFFPLYPLLTSGLARVLALSIPVAAVIVTNACALGCVYLLLRLG